MSDLTDYEQDVLATVEHRLREIQRTPVLF